MSLTLVGVLSTGEIRQMLDRPRMRIGRAGHCEIHVPQPAVSREHAVIQVDGDHVVIDDLGSRNGTWVNGNRIAGPTTLKHGDRIELAGHVFEIHGRAPSTNTILAGDAAMASSAAIDWKEIYGTTDTTTSALDSKKLNLFQVLAEAGEVLTVQSDLEDLFEHTLDLVDKAVTAERIVLLLNEDDEDADPAVRASRLKKPGASGQILLSKTMLDKVMEERKSFLTLDATEDPGLRDHQSVILSGTRSAMAVPLFDNEHVIGALYADTTDPITRYSKDELRTFTILANIIGVKITQARLAGAEEDRRRLEMQLQTAKDILKQILPTDLEEVPGYELCAYLEPSQTVGGDLYDARTLPDGRVAVFMGDVTGKGIGAALLVSNILASVNLLADEGHAPLALVERLNRQVHRSTDPVHFATFFYGVLDPKTGDLTYVNAGHNPPYLVRADGRVEEVAATGIPVGMLESVPYTDGTLRIAPGEFLTMFSDGIPEATTPDDEEYGEQRLVELLVRERNGSSQDIVDALLADVRAFLDGYPAGDDITILLLRRSA